MNDDGYANYRATLPGSHVYIGILGRGDDMVALEDFAWLGSQDAPGPHPVGRSALAVLDVVPRRLAGGCAGASGGVPGSCVGESSVRLVRSGTTTSANVACSG